MSQGINMWSVVLLVSICGLVQGRSRIDPIVYTKSGLFRGLQSDDGSAEFLGVPYAVVDENNPFGPSVPHPGFDYIFEAYESKVCPQVSNDNIAFGTIDCLNMNIYVPSIASSRNPLPVMVWIHGGGFSKGSSNSDGSTPNHLLRNDVIVVAINYRLGAYGFMCLDIPEVSGNQGLKDQVLALRWINENIGAFGGNPRQITAFGESAGGMSVNFHLYSSYETLFQRAIIQSGPALTLLSTKEHDNTIPIRLAQILDFNTTDIRQALAYLSSFDAHTIVKLVNDLNNDFGFLSNNAKIEIMPCIETEFEGIDQFITENPRNIVSSKMRSTPVIIGYNDNELAITFELVGQEYYETFNFEDSLTSGFVFNNDLDEARDAIKHFYIGDEKISENVKEGLANFLADFSFGYPTQRVADQLLQNGGTVYRYIFSYSGDRNLMKLVLNLNSTGATHVDELGYLFDFEMFSGETTPEDQLVIDRMTTMWTNFAKFGDPTPELTELIPIKWEPITKTAQPCLDINLDISLQGRPYHERMAFWDLFYKLYGKYLM